jgi:uncharacterized protein YjbI with pentapeptide repeats
MANEEQLAILRQGVEVWNKWRKNNPDIDVDLRGSYVKQGHIWEGDFHEINLDGADLSGVDLKSIDLRGCDLSGAQLSEADLSNADLSGTHLGSTNFRQANLKGAKFSYATLLDADLRESNLAEAKFDSTTFAVVNLTEAHLSGADFTRAFFGSVILGNNDLCDVLGLEKVEHRSSSTVGTDTIQLSRGKIPKAFLRGCGLSDADVEYSKLANPDLSSDEISKILYRIYDLRATQALQISPLFISYSHDNSQFVDKLENQLNTKGIRFWRDIHDMKAGRVEKQIDRAIRQNPIVLLVLSEHSLSSDWVEHEVRTARELEKDMERDVLCPVALDDSWKSSRWPKRVMEQIMEYNILDFSAWEDDVKFEGMFRKLIDGLELFYKG